MIAIEDIRDGDSLKQWLVECPKAYGLDETQARVLAVSIAHRAAMRPLPSRWNSSLAPDRIFDSGMFPMLRCCLITGVAAKILNPKIRVAVSSAEVALKTAYFPFSDVVGAIDALSAETMEDIATAITRDSKSRTHAGDWSAIRADCQLAADQEDLLIAPLWPRESKDDNFGTRWQGVKDKATAPEWSFWIKWYEDALAGTPQNWKMLEAIALIEDGVWEDGPEAVAQAIARIVERFDLLGEVQALKVARPKLLNVAASAEHRSHNNPPEILEVPAQAMKEITLVWDKVYEAENELTKSDPDTERLRKIANAILEGIAAVMKYCATVGNTVIMAGAKAVGGSGGVYLVDHYFNNGRVLEFAKNLLQYATGG